MGFLSRFQGLFQRREKPQMLTVSEVMNFVDSALRERHWPAADVGRLRTDWTSSISSATTNIRTDYKRLVARSKLAYDSDPYARSAVRVLADQIIGTGIRPTAKPRDEQGREMPELGKVIDEGFSRFNDEFSRPNQFTFFESQYQYIAELCTSGGMILNKVKSEAGSMLPFAWQMEDQSILSFEKENFTDIVHGIKIDDYGSPVSYFFEVSNNLSGLYQIKEIPASNVIHGFDKWHTTQYIGVPWLAPVLTTLWDLQNLLEDKIIASRIQAAIAFWMNSEDGSKLTAAKNTSGNVEIAPGKIIKSKHKPEVIQASDSIRDTFGALVEMYLRSISAGMGCSYQEMTSDLAGANFASSRTVIMDRRRSYTQRQKFVVRSYCKPVYRNAVEWMFLTGKIPGKSITDFRSNSWGYCEAMWTPDKWDWVDPVRDIEALVRQKDNGWITDEEYCQQTGKNRNGMYSTLAQEKAIKESLGIAQVEKQQMEPKTQKEPDDDDK